MNAHSAARIAHSIHQEFVSDPFGMNAKAGRFGLFSAEVEAFGRGVDDFARRVEALSDKLEDM